MKKNRKSLLLLSALCILVFLLSQCVNQVAGSDPRGPAFAGSDQCRQCHQPVYDLYVKSTHYNSTRPGSKENILGSFHDNENRLIFNDSTYVQMQERDSGLYQVLFVNGRETEAHRFDILFGLKHAQTSLYWKDNRTFELPVSFYKTFNTWGTSPGFSATKVNFNRFIGANCFECHSSYIGRQLNASTAGIEEVLDKNSLVYGIDCERCHGPALGHVNFHLANPDSKEPKHMVRFASLSREQKLDVCAVCHSGNNKMQEKSTFKFRPGDTLAHFFTIWHTGDTSTNFDVHGNQYQLLSQSKCFLQSKSMDCSSCHNPHTNASTDLGIYSAKCIGCHAGVVHQFAKETKDVQQLQNNCIDCHMPAQPSKAIAFQIAGSAEKSAYLLRTHKIAVYFQPPPKER